MFLSKVIEEAVECICSSERSMGEVAEKLSVLRSQDLSALGSKELPEQGFICPVRVSSADWKVAAVDSGFVSKTLASMDFTLVRAVGVVFNYSAGKLASTAYWPNLYSFPTPHLSNNALDRDELGCNQSLIRLREEIRTAQEMIEKFKPDYCLLDGSIVPQFADKPRKGSCVASLYKGIVSEFQNLYETAESNSCELVACVEDSRGKRFREILQNELLARVQIMQPERLDWMFDHSLLDFLLNVGERSFAFRYSKSTAEHPILMDYAQEWGSSIYAFYIKSAPLDRPLRVEMLHKSGSLTEHANKIASMVHVLSSLHKEYAYPAPLIEADLRARLKPEEINTVFNKIIDRLGRRTKLRLRRESRPF